MYTYATQIIARSYVHVWRTSRKYITLVLLWYSHQTSRGKYLIFDETRMDNFLISSSHPYFYGRGIIRVLEGVVELRMRPLLA